MIRTKTVIIATVIGVMLVSLGWYLFSTREKEIGGTGEKVLTIAYTAGRVEAIYDAAIEEFERRHPDLRVKKIPISGNYYQKVLVMIAGGVAPDVMWMGQSFSEFADRDVFLDISERVRKEKIDLSEYSPQVLSWYTFGDKLYSLPFGVDIQVMVFNLKLFREAGLPLPDDDWTFEEFLHAAQKLTLRDENGRVIRFGFRGGLQPALFGAAIFDEDGRVCCNTPEMIEALQTNYDLTTKYRVAPNSELDGAQSQDIFGYFRQEKAAMMTMETYNFPDAMEIFADMDWKIGLAPKVKTQSQWASSAALCISKDTKYPDEAWELMKISREKAFQMAMSVRSLPARRQFALEAVRDNPKLPPNAGVLIRALDIMAPTPRVPHLMELTAVYNRFSNQVSAGLLTPAEAMRQAEEELNRRLARFAAQRETTRNISGGEI